MTDEDFNKFKPLFDNELEEAKERLKLLKSMLDYSKMRVCIISGFSPIGKINEKEKKKYFDAIMDDFNVIHKVFENILNTEATYKHLANTNYAIINSVCSEKDSNVVLEYNKEYFNKIDSDFENFIEFLTKSNELKKKLIES